jgi:prepilin-type N-terminal cleavage/methylation domain-containing protein
MKTKSRQFGLTLPEMTVVVAIMALLAAIGLPAIRALVNSFETQSGARSMISAALSGARAIAAKEQHYAGVRFQRNSTGSQYMIFIVHDIEKTDLSPGFRAIEGAKPIKLPETTLAMDMTIRSNRADASDALDEPLTVVHLDDSNPLNIGIDGKNVSVTDTSTFSIIFSPAGKLVLRQVRVRNKDGTYRPNNSAAATTSTDEVFNSPHNITNFDVGMFIQDDYPQLGLGAEPSRNSFVICEKAKFDELNARGRYDYLRSLERVNINAYTGRIISPD